MTKREAWTMFMCVQSARKRQLSTQQIDWLLEERKRANFFVVCMKESGNAPR